MNEKNESLNRSVDSNKDDKVHTPPSILRRRLAKMGTQIDFSFNTASALGDEMELSIARAKNALVRACVLTLLLCRLLLSSLLLCGLLCRLLLCSLLFLWCR